MGKIFGAIGGFLGGIKGIGWLVKAIKLIGIIKPLLKEGYQVIDEGKDIMPVAKQFIEEIKDVKFGDTSPENIAKQEKALRTAVQLAKEAQEAGEEIRDIGEVLRKAKDILG